MRILFSLSLVLLVSFSIYANDDDSNEGVPGRRVGGGTRLISTHSLLATPHSPPTQYL